MLFGSYVGSPESAWMAGSVPGTTAVRRHLYQLDASGKWVWPPTNGPIPSQWPSAPSIAPNAHWILTVYPNPDRLLSGQMDNQIKAFIANAPALSYLTAYAEPDCPWTSPSGVRYAEQWTAVGISRAKMAQIHAKMHSLCSGTNVRYGIIACGFGATAQAYLSGAKDYCGIDIYDWADPMTNMDNFLKISQAASGYEKPSLMVSETNTNVVAKRPEWFTKIFAWLKNYEKRGGQVRAMCTYFGKGGPLSGEWLPGDAAAVETLTAIAKLAPR